MILSFSDFLNEAKFNVGYHAAPGVVMGSINKYGLDPKRSKYYSSDEIYFFKDRTEAHSYAVHMANYDGYEPFYIIQVDLKGIDLKKDTGLFPGSTEEIEDSAYYTTKPIPAKKIKVIDKV
jgi:hypothetical protein